MLHVLVQPEIKRRIGVGRRHDIPTGASVAQMVERSKPPRDLMGRIECGGAGRNEADPLGNLRQGRQQRELLERGRGMASL